MENYIEKEINILVKLIFLDTDPGRRAGLAMPIGKILESTAQNSEEVQENLERAMIAYQFAGANFLTSRNYRAAATAYTRTANVIKKIPGDEALYRDYKKYAREIRKKAAIYKVTENLSLVCRAFARHQLKKFASNS